MASAAKAKKWAGLCQWMPVTSLIDFGQ